MPTATNGKAMGSRRLPNEALRRLLDEAGWTGDALARAINAIGAEAGLLLHYQRASVTHWLSGMHPRPPVPELAAEAFTRRLGRRITVRETALGKPADPRRTPQEDPWWQADVVARLAELADDGSSRREFLTGCVYSLAALSVPAWDEYPTLYRIQDGPATGEGKIGRPEVASANLMLQLFSDADATFGGGYVRPALSTYLGTTIVPWLRAEVSPAARRGLFSVAARLTYLLGFACFDDNFHGVAERHFLTSLRLAAEAGDRVCYAAGLRQLSVQAQTLGHVQLAVHLAEAAVRTAKHTTAPGVQAFLVGQLAVATASGGARLTALSHLTTAEGHLERAQSNAEPVAAYHPASLAHQHAFVEAALGNRRGATSALTRSVQHRPAGERRSQAITLARLAEAHWTEGHLDEACQSWHRFLDVYPSLHSGRASAALANLRASTRAQQRAPAVQSLRHRTAALNSAI
jgi:hypothetical protein